MGLDPAARFDDAAGARSTSSLRVRRPPVPQGSERALPDEGRPSRRGAAVQERREAREGLARRLGPKAWPEGLECAIRWPKPRLGVCDDEGRFQELYYYFRPQEIILLPKRTFGEPVANLPAHLTSAVEPFPAMGFSLELPCLSGHETVIFRPSTRLGSARLSSHLIRPGLLEFAADIRSAHRAG